MLYDVEERRIINHLPEDMVNPLTGKRYTMAYNEGFFDRVRNAYSKIKSAFTKKNPENNSGFDPKKSVLTIDGETKFYRNPDGSTTVVEPNGATKTYTVPGPDLRQRIIETPPTSNRSQQSSSISSSKQTSTGTTSNGQSVSQVLQNGNTATNTTYTPIGNGQYRETQTSYTPVGQQQAPKQSIPPRTTSGNQSSSQVNVAPSNNTSTPSTINKKSYKKNLFSSNKSTNYKQPVSTSSLSTTVPKQPIPPRTTSGNQSASQVSQNGNTATNTTYTPIGNGQYRETQTSYTPIGQQQVPKQPIPPRTTSSSQSASQVSQNGRTATNNTYTSTGQQDLYRSQPVTVTRTKVGEKRVVDDPNIQRVTLPDGRQAIQTTSYIKVRPNKFIDRAKLAWFGAKQVFKDEMKSSGAFDKLKSLFGFGESQLEKVIIIIITNMMILEIICIGTNLFCFTSVSNYHQHIYKIYEEE